MSWEERVLELGIEMLAGSLAGVSGRKWPEWCGAKVAFDLPERGGRTQTGA